MRKVLVEFNLESEGVKRKLDVTKLDKTVIVYLRQVVREYVDSSNNPHLPWVDGGILFMHASYETRFTILMEK